MLLLWRCSANRSDSMIEMLKRLLCVMFLTAYPLLTLSKVISISVVESSSNKPFVMKLDAAKTKVGLYEGAHLLKQYDNLIRNNSTLSSSLVPVVGGGVAIQIESEGSRRKYRMLVPIELSGRTLFSDCVMKSVYDSVDDSRSVGMVCKRIPLEKFDIDLAINDEGLKTYIAKNPQASNDRREECQFLSSFEVAQDIVESCDVDGPSDQKNMVVRLSSNSGRKLFSLAGFEFIPSSGDQFSLISELANSVVILRGRLSCFTKDESGLSKTHVGEALLGERHSISYSFTSNDTCIQGSYSYAGNQGRLALVGSKFGQFSYFLELTENDAITGAFALTSIEPQLKGIWISIPPKRLLDIK